MNKLTTAMHDVRFRLEKRRPTSKRYSKGDVIQYSLLCLTQLGISVKSTDTQCCEEAVSQVCHDIDWSCALEVILKGSTVSGVQVLKKNGEVLFSHEMQDIAYCLVHDRYPPVFTFLSERGDGLFCHVFMCLDGEEASAIWHSMNGIFKEAADEAKQQKIIDKSRISWFSNDRRLSDADKKICKSKQQSSNNQCDYSSDEDSDETKSLID